MIVVWDYIISKELRFRFKCIFLLILFYKNGIFGIENKFYKKVIEGIFFDLMFLSMCGFGVLCVKFKLKSIDFRYKM